LISIKHTIIGGLLQGVVLLKQTTVEINNRNNNALCDYFTKVFLGFFKLYPHESNRGGYRIFFAGIQKGVVEIINFTQHYNYKCVRMLF